MRSIFLAAAEVARGVIAHPSVAARWEAPSALAEMTVGALAGHLVRAVTSVGAYLERDRPGPDTEPLDAAGYYLSIDGISGDLDSDLHRAIRERATQEAAGGHTDLVDRWDVALETLRHTLASEPPETLIGALGNRAIRIDDYLVTRLVEMVIHTDDLAVSIGADPPHFSEEATAAVIECLLEVARRRHGDLAVIRALSRRERDTVEALRVF